MSKSILITGASGNLGSVVSKILHEEGYQVFGTKSPGSTAESEIIKYFDCDLTSEPSVVQLFDKLKKETKSIYGVICLAGGFEMTNLLNSSSESMMKMLQINYFTAFHTAGAACSWMNETDGGEIIFIGAKPAMEGGGSEMLPYTISKTAVIKLAEIINSDSNLKDIRASVIIPSIIDTPLNRKYMPDADFRKWISPESIANHLLFLLSDKSKGWKEPILKLYNES